MTFQVTEVSWADPEGAVLRKAQQEELDARYGIDNHEPGTPPSAADIEVFLLARDADGQAVGCGALRLLGPDSVEIKRMYVTPSARGSGVAVAVLRALENEARRRGLRTLLLETGTAQPDAMRFYEREGYRPIENFGVYVGSELSRCYRRDL
ncbi:GNAT family N-acetyltransferase [Crossiella cryophila]|uniref:GNAT superfamily N-acetyltransferase n=1 Tax=Crossiella cryophila TaxID=43355 RepID=A0A7W7FWV8_9PSEU|nr:GNAT family N-acetyltransferase [Crossiella cryophila]MBB4680465.1 GNAT superfamily N-acetyltransferase [Crossiella cryophila]